MSWEIEEQVPDGWKLRRLGEVVKVVGGGTPKTSIANNFSDSDGHPWITPADLAGYSEKYISHGRRFLTDQGLSSSSAKYMPAGTVLFSSRAPVGYIAIASNPVTTNQGFRSLVPGDDVDSEYLYYALKFLTPLAESLASGTTFPELSGSKAAQLPFAYPSITQQQKIARALDAVALARQSAKGHLADVRQVIERFRRSVLAAASTGRLTEDWRRDNSTADGRELADHLISETPKSATWRVIDEDEAARAMPNTWALAPFRAVTANHDGKRVPVRASDRAKMNGPYPYYGASGIIDHVDRFLFDGDYLLISEDGANLLARATPIAFRASGQFWVNNHAHVVQPREGMIDSYIELVINAMDIQNYVTGSAQPKLTQAALNQFPIPVPPTSEQEEIVRRVGQLMKLADDVRTRIESVSTAVERSSHAVLAKAFRGELVTTKQGENPSEQ